jgi:hypothetical protein
MAMQNRSAPFERIVLMLCVRGLGVALGIATIIASAAVLF